MKRFHVHVAVEDLDATIRFYSTVFGMPPTVRKTDYAKWMLDDPRINFAISRGAGAPGIDHLGIQVDSGEESTLLREQMARAQIATQNQPNAECCYARSDKYWTTDPQGIAWETFHTLEAISVRGQAARPESNACCGKAPPDESPSSKAGACCA